jgi:hypothetical protein
MSLKFSDKPQLLYGGSNRHSQNWGSRFPQGAQPIATAPQNSATPVIVYEPNGKGHWALNHGGGWRKLAPFKDWRSGAVQWRMTGESINQPSAWSLPQRKK